MTRAKLWALAGLPVLLVGCGGGQDAAVEEMPDMAITDTAEPMEMGAMATTVTLQPTQDSGVTGEGTLTPQGAEMQVMVRLTGLTEGGEHPGHIHSGTCDAVGPVVVPLQPITGGADGTGTMTATVQVDPNTVLAGQHVIQYHQAGGGPGITCGDIVAHQM